MYRKFLIALMSETMIDVQVSRGEPEMSSIMSMVNGTSGNSNMGGMESDSIVSRVQSRKILLLISTLRLDYPLSFAGTPSECESYCTVAGPGPGYLAPS